MTKNNQSSPRRAIKFIKNLLAAVSNKHMLFLFIVFILAMISIRIANSQVIEASNGIGVLDLNFGNSEAHIKQSIDALGENGRSAYLTIFYVVDLFYPIVYALFYSRLIIFLAKKIKPQKLSTLIHRLRFLPWLAMVLDWLENLSIGTLLAHYPTEYGFLYSSVANVATIGKFTLIYTIAGTSLIVVVYLIIQKMITYKNKDET